MGKQVASRGKFFAHRGWVSFLLFSLKRKKGERKGKKGRKRKKEEREKKKEGRKKEEREKKKREVCKVLPVP